MKNLNMFAKYSPKPERRIMTPEQKEQILLARVVKSESWNAIKRATAHCLNPYAASPPMKLNLLIGFVTFSILRDGFNQLLQYIETEASKAPDPNDFDE